MVRTLSLSLSLSLSSLPASRREYETYPQGEKLEMEEIYEEHGMAKADAQRVTKLMAMYKDIFIDRMMVEGTYPPAPPPLSPSSLPQSLA